jgi:hypothetical protein
MNDKRLVQGLLIGACIALLVGVAVTWLNIKPYKSADKAPTPRARTAQPDPEPAPDSPVEPEPDSPAEPDADTPA